MSGFSPRWAIGTGLLLLGCVATACGSTPPDVLESVYRVEVGQCLAVENQLATAAAINSDRLVTVAHSLDEADGVTIKDGDGLEVDVELQYVDPSKDIAIFAIIEGSAVPLELAEPGESGSVTVAAGARDGGPVAKDATILDLVDATLDGEGKRAAIKLDADIKPGDSGAAVVDAEGKMVGMVFATARGENIGWAVASSEIVAAIDQLDANGPETIKLSC